MITPLKAMLAKATLGGCLLLGTLVLPAQASEKHAETVTANTATEMDKAHYARHDFPYRSHYVEVMGSKMHYVDTGGPGDPVLMIHGQPTWSYLWRNVIPHVEDNGKGKKRRVIALDLIGFGKSDKPDIEYLSTDHAKYLEGFIDALALNNITLVLHDWGSILGFNYAATHPDRVKAIAFMEAVVITPPAEAPFTPVKTKLSGPKPSPKDFFFNILTQIKTPGVGEKMILEDNFFLEKLVVPSFADILTEDEKDAYLEPFSEGKNRLPMLQFPRDVPILDGTPEYTARMVGNYDRYLHTQKNLPKLLLHLSEGFLINRWDAHWIKNNIPDVTSYNMGPGDHFMQEYNPVGIGTAISLWMDANNL